MEDRLLEGKVALVTGGGRGVGRGICAGAGRGGAKVVVNDLGATLDGQVSGEQPAHEVVATIRAAGGEAITDGGNVADWTAAHRMVQTCGRDLRPHRHRRQQRRHPARRDVPPHERGRVRRRGRRAPEGQLQRQPRRRHALQGAERRCLRAHDVDLGPGRQLRPGQLFGRQAGDRRPVQEHRAGHAEVRRALQRGGALCLDAHDRQHPGRDARAAGAWRT
jgi:hypothetical protein